MLALAFFLSGAAALALQTVWIRLLGDVIGNATTSMAIVTATFMGGLALGSALGGRWVDRNLANASSRRRLLLAYLGCELGVAFYGWLLLLAIPFVSSVHASLWRAAGASWFFEIGQTFLVAGLLILPTCLMGATLPLILCASNGDRVDPRTVGKLYACNTLGAVVGLLASGLWIVPQLGLIGATAAASAAAGMAATFALLRINFPPRFSELDAFDPPAEACDDAKLGMPAKHAGRLILAVYAASGACAMAAEVVLYRMFAMVLGSSVFSFALVLALLLLGIAVGSSAASRWMNHRPVTWLCRMTTFSAFSLLVAHFLVGKMAVLWLALTEQAPQITWVHKALLVGSATLPLGFGFGAVAPLAISCYRVLHDKAGKSIANAYVANTCGAIVGSLGAGLLALPLLGTERTFTCVVLVAAISALLLTVASYRSGSRRSLMVSMVPLILVLCLPTWNRSDLTAGLFRVHVARAYQKQGGLLPRDIRFYFDGAVTTVSVEQVEDLFILKNNGKVEASNKTDMPTQILVGLWPLLAHQGPARDVFVVGYGSGVTVGAILQSDEVRALDVAELEPAIFTAADTFFSPFNHQPQNDPRMRRHIADGRTLLLAGNKTYDVIVSEPSNPWIAGIGSLFSVDFFNLAKKRLNPGGIFCQWVQLYEMSDTTIKVMYRSFSQAFPYVYAFTPGDETSDTILLGSETPLQLSVADISRKISTKPALANELLRAQVGDAFDLLGSFFLGPEDIAEFTKGVPVTTDLHPILEFRAALDLSERLRRVSFARVLRDQDWPYGGLSQLLGNAELQSHREALALALISYGRPKVAAKILGDAQNTMAGRILDLVAVRDFRDPEIDLVGSGPKLSDFFTHNPFLETPTPADLARLKEGLALWVEGEFQTSWSRLKLLPHRNTDLAGLDLDLLCAYTAYKSLDFVAARNVLRKLDKLSWYRAMHPSLSYYLGRTYYGQGSFRKAVQVLQRYVWLTSRKVE